MPCFTTAKETVFHKRGCKAGDSPQDKDTSGLLIVAKTDEAHNGLSVQIATMCSPENMKQSATR